MPGPTTMKNGVLEPLRTARAFIMSTFPSSTMASTGSPRIPVPPSWATFAAPVAAVAARRRPKLHSTTSHIAWVKALARKPSWSHAWEHAGSTQE